jgi:hypothetical protein
MKLEHKKEKLRIPFPDSLNLQHFDNHICLQAEEELKISLIKRSANTQPEKLFLEWKANNVTYDSIKFFVGDSTVLDLPRDKLIFKDDTSVIPLGKKLPDDQVLPMMLVLDGVCHPVSKEGKSPYAMVKPMYTTRSLFPFQDYTVNAMGLGSIPYFPKVLTTDYIRTLNSSISYENKDRALIRQTTNGIRGFSLQAPSSTSSLMWDDQKLMTIRVEAPKLELIYDEDDNSLYWRAPECSKRGLDEYKGTVTVTELVKEASLTDTNDKMDDESDDSKMNICGGSFVFSTEDVGKTFEVKFFKNSVELAKRTVRIEKKPISTGQSLMIVFGILLFALIIGVCVYRRRRRRNASKGNTKKRPLLFLSELNRSKTVTFETTKKADESIIDANGDLKRLSAEFRRV